jgi:hypothetical protein
MQSNQGATLIIDHSKREQAPVTFDVTAVSPDGQYVPLTAGTVIWTACEIAKARSRDAAWAAVQVRESRTGRIVATEVNGERQDAWLPPGQFAGPQIGQPFRFVCEECGVKMSTEPSDPQFCATCLAAGVTP